MIRTNRLFLRKWKQADLPFLSAILGSTTVMAFSDHGALDENAQKDWLEDKQKRAGDTLLPGTLAIETQADGVMAGYISLLRGNQRVKTREAELGFRLAENVWGHGYATEAALAVIKASAEIAQLDRIIAIVAPDNHRSVRVLQKSGFAYEADIMFDGYDYPDHRYGRPLS